MFDYIPIVSDRMVLAIMKNGIQTDGLDLYFRPFTKYSWIMVGITIIVFVVILQCLKHLIKFSILQNTDILSKTNRVVIFIAWSCYVLIEVYYEGALTMFFTTESGIPFQSIKDVMKAYPEWRLLMRNGFEAYYIDYVDAGNVDYIQYWDRVQQNPEGNTFSSVGSAIATHSKDRVVIHDLQGAIDTYAKYGKSDTMDHLSIFAKGRTEWYGLIVTENSPLGPMLKHGAKQMHERGVFDYLKAKWLGGEKRCRTLSDISSSNMVLTFQHVSFIFLVFGSSVALCIVLFLLEIGKRYFLQEVENSNPNSTLLKKFRSKTNVKDKDLINDRKPRKISIFNLVWNVERSLL